MSHLQIAFKVAHILVHTYKKYIIFFFSGKTHKNTLHLSAQLTPYTIKGSILCYTTLENIALCPFFLKSYILSVYWQIYWHIEKGHKLWNQTIYRTYIGTHFLIMLQLLHYIKCSIILPNDDVSITSSTSGRIQTCKWLFVMWDKWLFFEFRMQTCKKI